MTIEKLNEFITVDTEFWDCECETKYIHHKARLRECRRCGVIADEQPDSRANEVKYMYDINDGWR